MAELSSTALDIVEGFACGRLKKRMADSISELAVDFARSEKERTDLSLEKTALETALREANISLTGSKKELAERTQELARDLAIANAEIARRDATIEQLAIPNKGSIALLPEETQDVVLSYWNRYPAAEIAYQGRFFGKEKNTISVDVRDFATCGTSSFKIFNLEKQIGAYVPDIMAANKGMEIYQAWDVAMCKIASHSFAYVFDMPSWGVNELWQFAPETLEGQRGDCDDEAVRRDVMATIAGVPEELRRIAAGMTFGGEGHATNYYLASSLSWLHINSTTKYDRDGGIGQFRRNGDSTDKYGLKEYWFTFTKSRAYHAFDTATARTNYFRHSKGTSFEPKYLRISRNGRRII